MKKVLVIEDDAAMRNLLSVELALMGFEAVTAGGGREGIFKAISEKPDLVLLDILLPDMDGRDIARTLRRNPEAKDIPIVAETALSDRRDLNTCLDAGCDEYLVKPFSYKDLEEKLHLFI